MSKLIEYELGSQQVASSNLSYYYYTHSVFDDYDDE